MSWRLAVLVVLLGLPGAPLVPPAPAAGADPPARLRFTLRDTAGATHTERSWESARAVVVFFVTPDCPVSQGYVPEMNRIEQAYVQRGVKFLAVQSDTTYADADVGRHVAEFAYRFPMLLDPSQILVRHTGATITPEALVMTPSGRVLYQGRIDNRIASLGVRRPEATEHDLRNALDDVLAGRPVARPRTTAYGCIISRRS
jgi:peroxiredoxin